MPSVGAGQARGKRGPRSERFSLLHELGGKWMVGVEPPPPGSSLVGLGSVPALAYGSAGSLPRSGLGAALRGCGEPAPRSGVGG